MSRDDRTVPPSEWFPGAYRITDDVYASVMDEAPPNSREDAGGGRVIVWHWCPVAKRWDGAYCGRHQLLSVEPLHLDPSLICPAPPGCGWHGWLRDGQWVPTT